MIRVALNRLCLSGVTRRYHVIAREQIPSNLQERVSILHAEALLKSGNKYTIGGAGETFNRQEERQNLVVKKRSTKYEREPTGAEYKVLEEKRNTNYSSERGEP